MSSAQLQAAVIEALRGRVPGEAPWTMRDVRFAVGCSAAEAAAAVQALRYQGKIAWGALELSPSMVAQSGGEEPSTQSSSGAALEAEGGGRGRFETVAQTREPPPSDDEQASGAVLSAPTRAADGPGGSGTELLSGPDDDEPEPDDYPGEVNDQARERPAFPSTPPGGWRKASNVAGVRPVPVPEHEPEIARLVREEAESATGRRRLARCTGTVRQPLEARKFKIPDLTLHEGVATMLAEDPQDIMRAVQRKHPATWRRVVLLARQLGQSPMQTLYAALERGLDQLETTEVSDAA